MAVNKTKLRTLNRLCERGFDTEKKISAVDMEIAYENGLSDELGGIIELKKAIKAHGGIAWLCDGEDKRKETKYAGTEQTDTTKQYTGESEYGTYA